MAWSDPVINARAQPATIHPMLAATTFDAPDAFEVAAALGELDDAPDRDDAADDDPAADADEEAEGAELVEDIAACD